MTVKQLRLWLESIEDQDREIPVEIVIGVMDLETKARLNAFLSFMFLHSIDEPVRAEAISLLIRLQIP